MKKRLQNMMIQQRISYSFIIFFTVFAVCVIIGLRGIYKDQMYEKLIQGRNYEDNLIVQQIGMLSTNLNSCCNSVIVNLNNTPGLKKNNSLYPDLYDSAAKQTILNIIENSFLMFLDVSQIAVLYSNGDLYQKDRNRSYICSDGNDDLIQQFDSMGISTTGQWYYSLQMESAFSEFSLHYVKTLRDVKENTDIGYVILELDEQNIYDIYRNKNSSEDVEFYLLDYNQMMISSDDRDAMNNIKAISAYDSQLGYSKNIIRKLDEKISDTGNYYTSEYQVNDLWNLVSVLDVKSMLSDVNNITIVIISISLVLLMIFYMLTIMIARHIAGPISALSEHMRKFTKSLPEKLPDIDTHNEEGILISSFNQMVDMNQQLFEDITNEKKEKRQLELALLQAQIKPHFLYNTLDTIFCLNSMKRHADASRMIKLLAGYYRLVLNKGLDWVWLDQELDALQKYLDIQTVRYQDSLSYSIAMPEELSALHIPKLTLQPLVENAIYHGIKPRNGKGHILITGELEEEWAYIRVIDDGIGLTKEKFALILSGEQRETDSESFGLKNVSERLKIFYGEGTCIQLEDTPLGTSIVLCINLKRGEEHEL